MKVTVELSISMDMNGSSFDSYKDFGVLDIHWMELSEERRKEIVQNFFNEQTDQPYWVVDSIKTER